MWTNQVSIGFEDADDTPAALEMDLEKGDLAGDKMIPLKAFKFKNVDAVTILLEDSEGGDLSAIASIKVRRVLVAEARNESQVASRDTNNPFDVLVETRLDSSLVRRCRGPT